MIAQPTIVDEIRWLFTDPEWRRDQLLNTSFWRYNWQHHVVYEFTRHRTVTATLPYWMRFDETVETVELDRKIAPLVRAFWSAGIGTMFSCQGRPKKEGRPAYVVAGLDDDGKAWLSGIADRADVTIDLGAKQVSLATRDIKRLTAAVNAAPPLHEHPAELYPRYRPPEAVLAEEVCTILRKCGGVDWHLRDDEPYRSLRGVFHDHDLLATR